MGRIEILEKLNIELKKDIHTECQVVYILSKIRKCLEINNQKSEYKYLNFYCNWALHSKINRAEPVADIIREFINDKDNGKFLQFDYLIKDLRRFFKDNSLSKKLFETENYLRFANLLVEIYSDTPLEIYCERKRIITIKKPLKKLTESVFSIAYEIK